MAAKPLDIRIIKGGTREPDYSASYLRFYFLSLIKPQAFFLPYFPYPAPAAVGGASGPSITGMTVCSFRRV
jgi:hypothetical protein